LCDLVAVIGHIHDLLFKGDKERIDLKVFILDARRVGIKTFELFGTAAQARYQQHGTGNCKNMFTMHG
jgi:hypothetical protein